MEVESSGTEAFVLKSVAPGPTPIKITCNVESDSGTILNPNGGGAGTSEERIEFKTCTVNEPAGGGCKVKEPIIAEAVDVLELVGGAAQVKFSPVGVNFTEITLENCINAGLNKAYPVKGTDNGIVRNGTSEIEFTAATSHLTFGGENATLKGKTVVMGKGFVTLHDVGVAE